MKLCTSAVALTVLALLTSTQGAAIPDSLDDGVYVVRRDASGVDIYERVANVTQRSGGRSHARGFADLNPLIARDDGSDGPHCKAAMPLTDGSHIKMQASDLADAVGQLGQQCDTGGGSFIPGSYNGVPGRALVLNRAGGTAIAYVCNYSTNSQACSSPELSDQISKVFLQCSPGASETDQVGWFTNSGWGPKNYGYDTPGDLNNIC